MIRIHSPGNAAAALACCFALLSGTAQASAAFRMTPYVQNPSPGAVTLIWFSNGSKPGTVRLQRTGDAHPARSFRSQPERADALAYQRAEVAKLDPATPVEPPWHHEVRLDGLQPGGSYEYSVEQDGEVASGHFRTPGGRGEALRFIVYGDSETEPESTGKPARWPAADPAQGERYYPVDQTTGYRENLRVIAARKPAFVAIAGDLVESGGEQRDWYEFWRQNATLAASTYIVPALGNHDYFGGPGELGGYTTEASERAVARYKTWFDLPANGATNPAHEERYYELDWGPVSLLVLDLNNGQPNRSANDDNWRLLGEGEGGVAPDWKEGSEEYRWLERSLARAQRESAFTFVMFHQCPYSSGPHGPPPGEGPGEDILSGVPLRKLTPLFLRYGVDAVFTGHDEMYEHSIVPGREQRPDGQTAAHELHVYDVGIGGDGLRGPIPGLENPYRHFLAHTDSPEVRDPDGRLISGGKHYGHLEVNVGRNPQGDWEARMDAVYILPLAGKDGKIVEFQRRLYDDTTVLTAPER